jgi:hypothetical protein
MSELNIELLSRMLSLKYIIEKSRTEQKEKIIKSPFSENSYTIDTVKMSLMTSFLFLECPFTVNVILKPSPVHGKGVFAVRDIKAGSLLTLYPADIIQFRPKGITLEKAKFLTQEGGSALLSTSERIQNRIKSKTKLEKEFLKLKKYRLMISAQYSIVGDPTFDDNPFYLGHFINDRFTCTSSSEKARKLYLTLSMTKMNCRHVTIENDLHTAIVATRDLKCGEELFMSYGSDYWLEENGVK